MSKRRQRRLLMAFSVVLIAVPVHAFDFGTFTEALSGIDVKKLVDLGKKIGQASGEMPVEREIELGRQLTSQLLGAMTPVDDLGIQTYVSNVGRWLADQTERPDLPWHFTVVKTDTVGAFAAPGGHIIVTAGLILVMQDENELAGVLAHEISHVIEKHHVKAIVKQARTQLAKELASELVSQYTNSNPAITSALLNAGAQVYSQGLDHSDEYAADVAGVVVAARAGYDPVGLINVLITLDSISTDEPRMGLLTSTHPPTRERIDRLITASGDLAENYVGTLKNIQRFGALQSELLASIQ